MEESRFIYRHILLPNTATIERYTSPKSGPRSKRGGCFQWIWNYSPHHTHIEMSLRQEPEICLF